MKNDLPARADARTYIAWLADLKARYRNRQIKAAGHVNRAMLEFYWELGKDISERRFENSCGSGFYQKLSGDLRRELPDAKGLSPTNLKYCRYFHDLYAASGENRQQVADDLPRDELFSIPWGHRVQIITSSDFNNLRGEEKRAG